MSNQHSAYTFQLGIWLQALTISLLSQKTSCRTWQTTGVAVSNKNVSDKQKVNVNSPVMNPKHPENTFDQLLLRSLGKNNRYS